MKEIRETLSAKLLNRLEKVLFSLTLFLLTDKFSGFLNLLAYNPALKNTIHSLTGMPQKQVGPMVLAWLIAIVSIPLQMAVGYILLKLFIQPGIFGKISRIFFASNLAAVLVLSCTSWFWSIEPTATLNGLFLVLKITLIGFYISQRYSPREILELLIGVVIIASVLSVLAVWLIPKQSIHLGGEWRGIYDWKNFLGRLMSFGNALLIVYCFENRALPKRIFALCLFLLTGTLLLLSDSTTSLILWFGMCAVVILFGLWTKWIAHFKAPVKWSLGILMIFILSLAVWNYSIILVLLNKTSTLTGRTALWEILWGWFQKSPLFGFGYEAFWTQFPHGIRPPGPGWADGPATHAHNGYFDILLALGLLGLLLFLFALASSWKNALICLRQEKQIVWLWPVLALVYFTFANITYSVSIAFPDFHWALFVIVSGLVVSNRHQSAFVDNLPLMRKNNNGSPAQ